MGIFEVILVVWVTFVVISMIFTLIQMSVGPITIIYVVVLWLTVFGMVSMMLKQT